VEEKGYLGGRGGLFNFPRRAGTEGKLFLPSFSVFDLFRFDPEEDEFVDFELHFRFIGIHSLW